MEILGTVNNEVAARYIENGLQETGAVNIVTGMILITARLIRWASLMLFIATCTVLILLRLDKSKKGSHGIGYEAEEDRIYEPKNDVILQTVARILVPPDCDFRYLCNSRRASGARGGFSGGAVIERA